MPATPHPLPCSSSARRWARPASRGSTPRSSTTSRPRGRRSSSSTGAPAASSGRRSRSTRRASRAPRATSCCCSGAEPSMRWRTFCKLIVDLAEALGDADGRHARRAAGRRAALAPGPDHRAVLRRGPRPARRPAAHRPTRGRPASSACSTPPARRPACRPRRCGRRCPTTWPPPPTRRPRSRWCASSRASSASRSTRGELESAAADYERQVSLAVQSDPDVQAFVERLEQAAEEEEPTVSPQDCPPATPSPASSSASCASAARRPADPARPVCAFASSAVGWPAAVRGASRPGHRGRGVRRRSRESRRSPCQFCNTPGRPAGGGPGNTSHR